MFAREALHYVLWVWKSGTARQLMAPGITAGLLLQTEVHDVLLLRLLQPPLVSGEETALTVRHQFSATYPGSVAVAVLELLGDREAGGGGASLLEPDHPAQQLRVVLDPLLQQPHHRVKLVLSFQPGALGGSFTFSHVGGVQVRGLNLNYQYQVRSGPLTRTNL